MNGDREIHGLRTAGRCMEGRSAEPEAAAEPVWLVRAALVLFLIAFAAFLAREVRTVVDALGP